MRHKKLNLCAAIMLCFGLNVLQAQVAIPASGGTATGTGGSVSYSVGQIVYTTNVGVVGSIAQGVQHPYEISVVTAIKQATGISLEFVVYPNPATDYIKLKINNYDAENLVYYLYDINGNLLISSKIESNETSISMETLLPATYFLKLTEGSNIIKTFKIIKK